MKSRIVAFSTFVFVLGMSLPSFAWSTTNSPNHQPSVSSNNYLRAELLASFPTTPYSDVSRETRVLSGLRRL
jgi:hypothetical protein